jgi:hypothetical protein
MFNKKVFFIWANEDWTGNIALSTNNSNRIINEYNEENFIKNAENLIKYFEHDNYLKIENKPVFFIYHSHLISNIDDFYNILNKICIENNFDGVHLVLNSFEKEYEKYKNFYINFNYKIQSDSRFFDNTSKQICLDYKNYMDNENHLKKNIQTVIFNFDNRVRLFKPDRLKNSTICINNSEMNKIIFTKKIVETYKDKNNDLDKILLVNALNEWGENMVFEPSDKYEYYNINLLNSVL